MKEDTAQTTASNSGTKTKRPTRQLSFSSRVRKSLRHAVDRVLATDLIWSGMFVFVLVLLVGTQNCGSKVENYVEGQVAHEDIRAPIDFEYIDAPLTEKRRQAALDKLAPVYTYHREAAARLGLDLAEIFEQGRESYLRDPLPESVETPPGSVRSLELRVAPEALEVLVARRFDASIEREMNEALGQVLAGKIVANKALLNRQPSIVLLQIPGNQRVEVRTFEDFIDLSSAREQLRRRLIEKLAFPPSEDRALAELAASFVDANVQYDPETTRREQQETEQAVTPAVMHIAAGALLVAEGQRLTGEAVDRIDAANRALGRGFGTAEILGLAFLASLFAFFLYRYSRYHQRQFRKLEHLHSLLVLMLLSMLVLSRAILWLAGEVVDNLAGPYNQLESYTYLIPLGAGAILVALLANGRIATVYAAFAALLFGMANRWDPYLMVWALLVQCAGVYAISTYRERAALLRAGFVVGGAAAVSALALEIVENGTGPMGQAVYGAALAFLGGAVGVGLLISFSLPLTERLFKVLTDIRLLELSNVNNPLLSELAIRAPGSYNHSLVVGTLAEDAARAVGANSLFCRVAAFYHDVGKMNKAEYYVENQRGMNPHDRLTPSMSALIIASHVKDGIKLAREAGLPEQIVDIIPQHHGTKLMTYFFEKAKANADPALGPVKEEDFRYPGPKPQTKEAAIFMLSDAIEAAARTVDDPTANRLKEMIRKVTNSIVLDGQFDSCDLTFADLTRTQEAFLRTLVSMYHHRVDYPGFDFGKPREREKDRVGKTDVAGESKPEIKPDRKPGTKSESKPGSLAPELKPVGGSGSGKLAKSS